MANAAGESESSALQLDFDRRLMLQFRGSVVTSDAGLLAYRELDDVLRLTALAGEMLADARTGKNGRHALVGLLRQSAKNATLGLDRRRPAINGSALPGSPENRYHSPEVQGSSGESQLRVEQGGRALLGDRPRCSYAVDRSGG